MFCVIMSGRNVLVVFPFLYPTEVEKAKKRERLNNSVWITKPNRCHFCVMFYFLLYKLLNMFRATMCPSSGADDWLVFSPHVGIELWLQ